MPEQPKVLFSTNCYFKDWELLADGKFYDKFLLNDYPFKERWMTILNVPDPEEVADIFSTQADRVIIAEEVAKDVLEFFHLKKDDFKDKDGDGYIYSISSLIDLYLAKDFDYICHFCGDVELKTLNNWITEGIKKIDKDIVSARPLKPRYELSDPEDGQDKTQIFSDHCYLIPVSLFRNPDWIHAEPLVDNVHPKYGGKSFERRMTTYLQKNNLFESIISTAEVIHPCY